MYKYLILTMCYIGGGDDERLRNLNVRYAIRNRPEIRLNPAPAGFPASKSGSGSGSGWKKICRIFAGFQFFFTEKKSTKKFWLIINMVA